MAKTNKKKPETIEAAKVESTPLAAETTQELNLVGDQIIVGIGGGLKIGMEYRVGAELAMVLIKKGSAKLKTV